MSQFLQNPVLVPEGRAVSFIDSESQDLQIFMRAILISHAVNALLGDAVLEHLFTFRPRSPQGFESSRVLLTLSFIFGKFMISISASR